MSEEVISYHTFMFPFRWDRVKDYTDEEEFFKNVPLDERIKIDEYFHDTLKKCGWEYKPFKVNDSTSNYNEYVYFHKFAREALYNNKDSKKDSTSYYYEKYDSSNKDNKEHFFYNSKFILKIKDIDKPYELNIENISLKVFNTGIAILSINLSNNTYTKFDDILKINDFGRRIYPQFLGKKDGDYAYYTKESFLAEYIKIKNKYKEFFIFSITDFKYENKPENISLANYISYFLNKNKDIFNEKLKRGLNCENILISPILDDRMFVMSFLKNNLIEELKHFKYFSNEYSYKNSDLWYKYLFIDGKDKTCQSKVLSKKLIEEATYDRWIDYGTLYGITNYSFVLLVSKDAPEYLLNHFKTMYFQMINLVFAQRASILRFESEIALISDLKSEKVEKLTEKITMLYEHYLRFVNKLWFREVTAQEQGIEMYDLALKQMRLKVEVETIANEIKELNDFVTLQIENSRNEQATKLTEIATSFLPATLLAGILGMNVFNIENSYEEQQKFLLLFFALFLGLIFINFFSYKNLSKYFPKCLIFKPTTISIIITVILFLLTFYFVNKKVEIKKHTKNLLKIDQQTKVLLEDNKQIKTLVNINSKN